MFQWFRYRWVRFLYNYFSNSYLKEKGDVQISPWVKGVANVNCEGKNAIPEFCNFSGEIKLGYNTTLGVHNFLHGNITIGKYCQLGAYVAIHTTNHPITHLSTYINRNLFNGELKSLKKEGKIVIGHDVWVGHNAILVGNLKVGNGAIVAAGAVVTTDVPPYSIVGGVPAKVIRYRFSEKIIAEVENLQWWNKSEAELNALKPLFLKDLSQLESLTF